MIQLPVHTMVSCIRLWSTFYRKCGMSNSFNKRGTQKNSITMKTTFHSNSTETRYHERRGWHLDDKEGKDSTILTM